jgi:hypothetical protein
MIRSTAFALRSDDTDASLLCLTIKASGMLTHGPEGLRYSTLSTFSTWRHLSADRPVRVDVVCMRDHERVANTLFVNETA